MCLHISGVPASMCAVCTPVRHHTPTKREPRRIKRTDIPTWSQWIRFKQTEPLPHTGKCIMCKREISRLNMDTIKIGCKVKVSETTKFTVCNVEYEESTHKIIPVFLTGMGCPDCQYAYIKAQAAEMGRYAQEDAGYTKDLADPRKGKLMKMYGSSGPNKRQAVIDVTDLVLEMDRKPLALDKEVQHG